MVRHEPKVRFHAVSLDLGRNTSRVIQPRVPGHTERALPLVRTRWFLASNPLGAARAALPRIAPRPPILRLTSAVPMLPLYPWGSMARLTVSPDRRQRPDASAAMQTGNGPVLLNHPRMASGPAALSRFARKFSGSGGAPETTPLRRPAWRMAAAPQTHDAVVPATNVGQAALPHRNFQASPHSVANLSRGSSAPHRAGQAQSPTKPGSSRRNDEGQGSARLEQPAAPPGHLASLGRFPPDDGTAALREPLDETRADDPSAGQEARLSHGALFVDATALGHWVAEYLNQQVIRPPSGIVGVDPRMTAPWIGPLTER